MVQPGMLALAPVNFDPKRVILSFDSTGGSHRNREYRCREVDKLRFEGHVPHTIHSNRLTDLSWN